MTLHWQNFAKHWILIRTSCQHIITVFMVIWQNQCSRKLWRNGSWCCPLCNHSRPRRKEIGSVYAIAGRTEEAKLILRECEEASAHEPAVDVNHWCLALIQLKLGNKDRALEWLEKGFGARTTNPFEVKLWPFFDEITSDPRFEELMNKTLRSLNTTPQ